MFDQNLASHKSWSLSFALYTAIWTFLDQYTSFLHTIFQATSRHHVTLGPSVRRAPVFPLSKTSPHGDSGGVRQLVADHPPLLKLPSF